MIMKKFEIKNKTNSELLLEQSNKRTEFERVRTDIINLHNYWMSIESDYNLISEEINNRNTSKNGK